MKYTIKILISIIVAFVVVTGYKTVDPFDLGYQTQDFFGLQIYSIGSDSMFPALKTGDCVLVKHTDVSDLEKGDIVAYHLADSVIVHRVENFSDAFVITKGDSNNTPDAPVRNSDIIGKSIYTIPKMQTVIETIRKPSGFAAMIILAGSLIVFLETILKVIDSFFGFERRKIKE